MAYLSDSDSVPIANRQMSKYFHQLEDSEAKERYLKKLTIRDGEIPLPDPYLCEGNWVDDVSQSQCQWPGTEYGDIYQYLVETPGPYTRDNMKAYKSLEAYNYFQSGHVQTVYYWAVAPDIPVCFLRAKVTPSQRAGTDAHEAWVCVDKGRGYVVSAHCKCLAG